MTWIWTAAALGALLTYAGEPTPAKELRTVAQGAHSAMEQPGQQVIRTNEEWSKLWAQHSARSSAKTPPAVDFTQEMVLASFMGTRSTGGYVTTITGAQPINGKLTVSVTQQSPGPGTIRAQVVTSPFHFVAVKRSDLPVVWQVTQVTK